jgi:multicomponent Na+:H+ antiporter subunit C
MTSALFFSLVSIGLLTLGLYILLVEANLLRKIMALNIMGSSILTFVLAMGTRQSEGLDTLSQAWVFMGLIILLSATILALHLTQHIYQLSQKLDLLDETTKS